MICPARRRQAGGRFIQQQQLRPGRQTARHRQQLLLAVGQVAHEIVGAIGQADMIQDPHRFLAPRVCARAACSGRKIAPSGSSANWRGSPTITLSSAVRSTNSRRF
jgi:hypothetical protein